jgi:hypothetical protein
MIGVCQTNDIESLEEFRLRVPDDGTTRRLLEPLVWQNGRFCPAMRLYRDPIDPRISAWSLRMPRLPAAIYSDDADPAPRDQTADPALA